MIANFCIFVTHFTYLIFLHLFLHLMTVLILATLPLCPSLSHLTSPSSSITSLPIMLLSKCHVVESIDDKPESNISDDVCFLCKDGGELMECDYIHKDVAWKRRCQKVYHPYCLTFQVDSSEKCWRCPRHFCDTCSSMKLKYVCMYCPMSSCAACSDPMTGKVSKAFYSAHDCLLHE